MADVLFRAPDGAVRHDFKGKLSYSWPKRADQTPLNRGDAGYDPLFAYGFGLTYADAGELPKLSEERPAAAAGFDGVIFGRGNIPAGWTVGIAEEGNVVSQLMGNAGATGTNRLTVAGVDRNAQEDARRISWDGTGGAFVRIAPLAPIDISREANGELSLVIDYRVDERPTGPVRLGMRCVGADCGASVPIRGRLAAATPGEWTTLAVPLRCFRNAGVDMANVIIPFELATSGRLALSVSGVRIASAAVPQDRCGAE